MMPTPSVLATSAPSGIDWDLVYSRLEAYRTALERGVEPTPADRENILQRRAQALAREPQDVSLEAIEVVEFLLAHESYAIASAYVREVYPLNAFTPLPCTPPFVLGITNIHGQILSVIDLKKFFDLPDGGLTDLNQIIVVHDAHMVFGLLADAIVGVRSIPLKDIQASLPTLTGIREAYFQGVTGEGLVLVDAGRLLADPKLIICEEVEGDNP
jgi:purine-binding chemotaxis protein CheW